MIIGVDVDDTVGNFMNCFLDYYNKYYNTHFNYEDVDRNLEDIFGQNCFENIISIMKRDNAIENFSVIPGAIEFVNKLRELYGRVVFVTAPSWNYLGWCEQRRAWLINNFNCSDCDIIFINDKTLFDGDILIDDRQKYLDSWIEKTGKPAIKINRPWNKNAKGYPVNNFNEALEIIEKLSQVMY